MCVDGFCVASAPIDASMPVDARESEAGCGSLSNLRDDFGNGAIDPLWDPFTDPGATVSESGGQTRVDQKLGYETNIWPQAPAGEPPYRFQWATPVHISPHNSSIIYTGGQRLLRSTNRGDTWGAP